MRYDGKILIYENSKKQSLILSLMILLVQHLHILGTMENSSVYGS